MCIRLHRSLVNGLFYKNINANMIKINMCYTSHGNPILLTEEKSSSNVIMIAKVNEKKFILDVKEIN